MLKLLSLQRLPKIGYRLQSYHENSIPWRKQEHLMTLIKSISGIRGTVGGRPGEGLTPIDLVRFTAAFGTWALHQGPVKGARPLMVVGRDARPSGTMAASIVCSTLNALGIDVADAGLATTPTVEMAVTASGAIAGIIITASHNPGQWNALKLLDHRGEFIDARQGEEVLVLAAGEMFEFVEAERLGHTAMQDFLVRHIEKILELPEVDRGAIAQAGLSVVVDPVNSVGSLAVPALLNVLGVKKVHLLNGQPDGRFAHNPEPLPAHLGQLSKEVVARRANIGIAVDPDVDRLALVCEDGSFFGEEYTLVAVADYLLSIRGGNTVSNLSSSRALREITEKHGGKWTGTPVGEVHVVAGMKRCAARIGGEGNGGVIYPALHYGRDALVGIALFLSHLVKSKKKMTELRRELPEYSMAKMKMEIPPGTDLNKIMAEVRENYSGYPVDTSDGVKIDFPDSWVHLRRSNTEPIIRIYAEARTEPQAEGLARRIVQEVTDFVKNC
jgi:phosphomannomutase